MQNIVAPLSLEKISLSRKTTIRRQKVVNATRKSISALKEPVARALSLKLDLNTTPRAKSRPNFIFPFTALVHLNARRQAKNGDLRAAEGGPDLL